MISLGKSGTAYVPVWRELYPKQFVRSAYEEVDTLAWPRLRCSRYSQRLASMPSESLHGSTNPAMPKRVSLDLPGWRLREFADGIHVMSLDQTWLGAAGLKSRCSRSGATGRLCRLSVVTTNLRRPRAR